MNKKRFIPLFTVLLLVVSLATSVLATDAAQATSEEPAAWYAGILNSGILPIVIILVVFYFLLIRPENKKKKEIANMRNSLAVGDKITTIGGIIGRVTNVKDDQITIETGNDKSKLRLAKWAVSSVDKKKEEAAVSEEE